MTPEPLRLRARTHAEAAHREALLRAGRILGRRVALLEEMGRQYSVQVDKNAWLGARVLARCRYWRAGRLNRRLEREFERVFASCAAGGRERPA